MWLNTYKGKYPATTVLTPQDTRLAENHSENAGTNIQQKFRFQTSFQHKRLALMESEGIDKLAQYLLEPISQDVDMNEPYKILVQNG